MSERTGGTESMGDLAPAYALGALSPEEARAFEQALASSPGLQSELAEYREVCALLATAESAAPPVALKERLFDRVRTAKAADLAERRAGPAAGGPSRFALTVLGTGLAAAAVFAVVFGRQSQQLQGRIREQDSVIAERTRQLATREAELNAILEPGVQLVTLTASGEAPPVVQVFWDRQNNRALLHSFRLKPAPAGRAYQLWILPKQGNPIASSVFNTEADGHGLVTRIPIPADSAIAGFALTEEPASGSPQPTSTPFLIGMAQQSRE